MAPPERWCRRSESTNHYRKETLMTDPLTGTDEDLGVPTINVKNIDDMPPRRRELAEIQ
jgi:hypothetical protein